MKKLVLILVTIVLLSPPMDMTAGQSLKRSHVHSSLPGQTEEVLLGWQLQNSNLPSNAIVYGFSVVDSLVCWGLGYKYAPYPGYIRTTNGGSTWVCDSIAGAENGYISQIVALDADTADATVYVDSTDSSEGIYKTTNGGTSWTKQKAYSSALYGPGYIHFFDADVEYHRSLSDKVRGRHPYVGRWRSNKSRIDQTHSNMGFPWCT